MKIREESAFIQAKTTPANSEQWLQQRVFLVLVAALLTLPLLIRGNSCGHDFDFHLQSWMSVAQHWRQATFYPHWIEGANYGAGEPRFVFYPPLTWMLGALLGIALPWTATPAAFILIVLSCSGLAMEKLAREWLSPAAALTAACAYLISPYTLFLAYERTAYGELAGSIWIPWIVLYALRLAGTQHLIDLDSDRQRPPRKVSASSRGLTDHSSWGSILALALTIAGLWLTNAPAAVMGSYLLAAVALWAAVSRRSWNPILRSGAGFVLGLGLASFYLVPAAYERRWVEIARAVGPGMRIKDSFLFGHFGEAFHDQVLRTASWIFVDMLAAIILFGIAAWRQRSHRQLLIPLFGSSAILFVLQLRLSVFVWNYAPELKFLQFPWRLALLLTLCFALSIALSFANRCASGFTFARLTCLLAVTMAAALAAGTLLWQPCDEEDAVSAQIASFRSGGVEGTDEYATLGTDNSLIPRKLPRVRVVRAAESEISTEAGNQDDDGNFVYAPPPGAELPADVRVEGWLPEMKHLSIESPQAGYAVLRLRDYPAWRVRINHQPMDHRLHREDGLMVLALPPGASNLEIDWVATPDVLLGRGLSGLSGLALLGLTLLRRRQQPVRYHGENAS